MTIKSLLLGSAAVLALGTSAQAADPIAVALDTCDLLNITGLTISSESNCLKFSGEVTYDWEYAFDAGPDTYSTDSAIGWSLTMDATADSDFGPALASVTLENSGTSVVIDEAFVSIGDASATVIIAGMTGTIANRDDDESFTALFSLDVQDGNDEGFNTPGVTVGGHVIQVSTSLGDGITAGVGLENLDADGASGHATLVGTVGVDQDWGTAHATFVYDDLLNATNNWFIHAGATFNVSDDAKVRAAFSTISSGAWAAMVSAEATMDMFTLAAGAEFFDTGDWEAAVSGVAAVDDNTTLTVAVRFDDDSDWDLGLKGEFAVSDTLTASADVNFDESSLTAFGADLTWAPGGGYESSVGFDADSTGDYSFSTSFEKSFE